MLATIDAAGTPASHRLQIISCPLPVTNVLLRAKPSKAPFPSAP